MEQGELDRRLLEALAPLAEFIADNYADIERLCGAYSDWGTGWLEALANGYVTEDH